MSAFCDRCQEHTNQILKIANLPEVAAVSHLGYREVCAPCYDDLVAEASEVEGQKEDRRDEPRVKVSLKALVEGNTSHLEAFSDEMNVVEISKSGLRLSMNLRRAISSVSGMTCWFEATGRRSIRISCLNARSPCMAADFSNLLKSCSSAASRVGESAAGRQFM